jgi:hypothetical protein
VKDGSETGVDCGGPLCAPCSPGAGCLADADCFQGVCRSGSCVPVSCADGKKDGSETDVDCGGGCAPCAPGKACTTGHDCASHLCAGSLCATPSCTDGVKNASETGVDCGGGACPACAVGQTCGGASDCQSTFCVAGVCFPADCANGVKDGTETGKDCGGGVCPACPLGETCHGNADCALVACIGGTCVTPSCADGVKDGTESGKDCGGACPPCPLGETCNGNADCALLGCVGGTCATPSCTDGVTDGTETDTDCGGSCPLCDKGQHCATDADCKSLGCFGGVCDDKILISQVRTVGPNPDYLGDDFVEIYNPGSQPVTLDPSWMLFHLSAQYCMPDQPFVRLVGANQVMAPHSYYLLTGPSYAGPPGDEPLLGANALASIANAGSLRIVHGPLTVDALCFYFDDTTLGRLTGSCGPAYPCEGTPVSNVGPGGPSAAVDAAMERKPGGALGNQQDTNDSNADFQRIMPSHPRSSQSPPAP